jgi:hypothetical protein
MAYVPHEYVPLALHNGVATAADVAAWALAVTNGRVRMTGVNGTALLAMEKDDLVEMGMKDWVARANLLAVVAKEKELVGLVDDLAKSLATVQAAKVQRGVAPRLPPPAAAAAARQLAAHVLADQAAPTALEFYPPPQVATWLASYGFGAVASRVARRGVTGVQLLASSEDDLTKLVGGGGGDGDDAAAKALAKEIGALVRARNEADKDLLKTVVALRAWKVAQWDIVRGSW